MSRDEEQPPTDPPKIALQPPPNVPGDIIQSALHLPLTSLSTSSHVGRKVRIIAQVVQFDPSSGLAIVSCPGAEPSTRCPVLLVDLSVALLGQSPAAPDLSEAYGSTWVSNQTRIAGTKQVPNLARDNGRARVVIEKGGWVCVVGWLEKDERALSKRVDLGDGYAKPFGMILEAIHISAAREPPDGAIFRGDMEAWDGSIRRPAG